MRIKSNLKAIIDEKGLNPLQLSKKIDYRYESVRVMYNDTAKHYPKDLLLLLCKELEVTPGDLIIVENEKEPLE
ncbi:helix-turn-helix domain-containing protein [Paenibacillus sp. RS8]|uniref:helix-turn-helix domain-containing protein n=1 Tax=Paenibacillus sp. RS8 TaxID=3242681 RepID=UPI0035C14E11